MLLEKLTVGTEKVERLYELAQMADVDVIKLAWRQSGSAIKELSGLEVPVVAHTQQGMYIENDITDMVSFEEGIVYFYPDSSYNPVRWGYVLATESNIIKIAEALGSGVFIVKSKDYAEKIKAVAMRNGWRTEPAKQVHESVVKSDREEKAVKRAEEVSKELREAQARALAAEERIKELEQAHALAKLAARPDLVPVPTDRDDITASTIDAVNDPIAAAANLIGGKNKAPQKGAGSK